MAKAKVARRVMKDFIITEISAVDRPAQEGARAVIMKRADVDKAQGRHPAGSPQGGQFAPGSVGGGKAVLGGRVKQDQQSGMWESYDQGGKKKLHRTESDARRHLADRAAKKPILFGPQVGGGSAMGKNDGAYVKRLRLTTAEDGHSHLVDDSLEGGTTSYDKAEGDDYGHSHPWVRNDDGSITIGESSGHGHDVMMTKANDEKSPDEEDNKEIKNGEKPARRRSKNKSAETADELGNDEDDMTDSKKNVAAGDEAAAELKAAKEQIARLSKMADMTDAEKAFMKGLPADQQDAFLNAPAAERVQTVQKANDANAVVYKTDDGREFRKSDDPRLVAMAKQNDETMRELRKARQEQAEANFAKRADDEIPHLPGTAAERGALLKAIDAMPPEAKEAALKSLKAGSNALSGSFKRHGNAEGKTEDGSPVDVLDKKAKEVAKAKNISYVDAYDIVKRENPELYAKAVMGPSAPTTAQVVGG